jgi:hypothetical protein
LSGIVIASGFFCFFLKTICQGGGGLILGFLCCFLRGFLGKVVDVDGFLVVSLWCFDGEAVVPCVVFL